MCCIVEVFKKKRQRQTAFSFFFLPSRTCTGNCQTGIHRRKEADQEEGGGGGRRGRGRICGGESSGSTGGEGSSRVPAQMEGLHRVSESIKS